MKNNFFKEYKVLGILCFLFLSLCFINIKLPAVHNDEACDGLWASYILNPKIDILEPHFYLRCRGYFFPIMANNSYTDTIESYLLVPLFCILGINVLSLRVLPIIFFDAFGYLYVMHPISQEIFKLELALC